jgi:hypothetical protein
MCDEWRCSFAAFWFWAWLNGYRDDLTIDRIDGSKGYCPENCRWATRSEQNRNRRYSEALNVLAGVEDHSALWYYYSAIANAGLGNHAQALEHATIAAEMEPNNYSYQNLVTQLSRGSRNYQQHENTYVRTYDSGQWCIRLCILNAFINLCCGRGFFCC